jgi:hypothetical protein
MTIRGQARPKVPKSDQARITLRKRNKSYQPSESVICFTRFDGEWPSMTKLDHALPNVSINYLHWTIVTKSDHDLSSVSKRDQMRMDDYVWRKLINHERGKKNGRERPGWQCVTMHDYREKPWKVLPCASKLELAWQSWVRNTAKRDQERQCVIKRDQHWGMLITRGETFTSMRVVRKSAKAWPFVTKLNGKWVRMTMC